MSTGENKPTINEIVIKGTEKYLDAPTKRLVADVNDGIRNANGVIYQNKQLNPTQETRDENLAEAWEKIGGSKLGINYGTLHDGMRAVNNAYTAMKAQQKDTWQEWKDRERARENMADAKAAEFAEMRRQGGFQPQVDAMLKKLEQESKIYQTGEYAWAGHQYEYKTGKPVKKLSLVQRDMDGAERLAEANKSPEAMAKFIAEIAGDIQNTHNDKENAEYYQSAVKIKGALDTAKNAYGKAIVEAGDDTAKKAAALKAYDEAVRAQLEATRLAKLQSDLAREQEDIKRNRALIDNNETTKGKDDKVVPVVSAEAKQVAAAAINDAQVNSALFERQLRQAETVSAPDKQAKVAAYIKQLREEQKNNPNPTAAYNEAINARIAKFENLSTATAQAAGAQGYLDNVKKGEDARAILHADNIGKFKEGLKGLVTENFNEQIQQAKKAGHIAADDPVIKELEAKKNQVLTNLDNPSNELTNQIKAALETINRSDLNAVEKIKLRSDLFAEASKAAVANAGDDDKFASKFFKGALSGQDLEHKALLAQVAPVDVASLVQGHDPKDVYKVTVKDGRVKIHFGGGKSEEIAVDTRALAQNGIDLSGLRKNVHLDVDMMSGFDKQRSLAVFSSKDQRVNVGAVKDYNVGVTTGEDLSRMASVVRGVKSATGNQSLEESVKVAARNLDDVALDKEINKAMAEAKKEQARAAKFAQLEKTNPKAFAALLSKHPELENMNVAFNMSSAGANGVVPEGKPLGGRELRGGVDFGTTA